LAGVST
jgi:hypothetical protein